MRVTQNSTSGQILSNLQTILQRQDQLEQYASTGVKVSNPGDDPVAVQQILHLKTLTGSGDQYAKNISTGSSTLSIAESVMSSMGDTLVRAKELALSVANDTVSDASRNAAATELQQLKDHMISLGNTQFNGKYIFGGFKNDTPPFDANGNFVGTDDEIKIEVAQGSFVPVNFSGGKLLSAGTNVVGIFTNLINALQTPGGNKVAVQTELGTLDDAQGQILAARSDVGARMNRLTSAGTVNEDMKFSVTKVLSNMQDVDFAQVVSDLSKQQVAFQTAVASSAKIAQVSLLDYLK